MQDRIRIGNAQAFWGDSPSAPARLLQQQPDLDYLTLDYLAEVSLSIMAIQRDKNPQLGYAQDFVEVIKSLAPHWKAGSHVKVVTNAGGLNPKACAQQCQEVLNAHGCTHIRVGVVDGDDVLAILQSHAQNPLFLNLDTKQSLTQVSNQLVTANAYFGAQPISDLLKKGAHIVITGRTADPSLTVGPCIAHFGWLPNDYDRIASATIAGHLIECGTQVTGGISTHWLSLPDPIHIGFPVIEMSSDGSFVVTKPAHTGGSVTMETVKEQLLYEIGDPENYLSPDATVSFLNITLKEVGKDRISIQNAKGRAPTETYKVSATYRDGYRCDAMLALFGRDIREKAKRCGEIVLERVKQCGYPLQRTHIECIGQNAVVPGVFHSTNEPLECILRIAVADKRQEALECFSKEVAQLVTAGPQGVTGYISGRPHIRPVFGYWPCLIEKSKAVPRISL